MDGFAIFHPMIGTCLVSKEWTSGASFSKLNEKRSIQDVVSMLTVIGFNAMEAGEEAVPLSLLEHPDGAISIHSEDLAVAIFSSLPGIAGASSIKYTAEAFYNEFVNFLKTHNLPPPERFQGFTATQSVAWRKNGLRSCILSALAASMEGLCGVVTGDCEILWITISIRPPTPPDSPSSSRPSNRSKRRWWKKEKPKIAISSLPQPVELAPNPDGVFRLFIGGSNSQFIDAQVPNVVAGVDGAIRPGCPNVFVTTTPHGEDVLVVSTLGHHLAVSVNNPPSSTRLIASAQHLPNALVSWATVMASVI
eukprot:TRINITY_DN1274_c0_g1_i3.p1 TRINITY_DN1274_c0_g1~~TRINITY_DN1274_c0_g1_i3.p1  ORF type:complete len:307 (-),score=20.99 TRINITY_DN1274_c0_g1_i3:176-1096(-)